MLDLGKSPPGVRSIFWLSSPIPLRTDILYPTGDIACQTCNASRFPTDHCECCLRRRANRRAVVLTHDTPVFHPKLAYLINLVLIQGQSAFATHTEKVHRKNDCDAGNRGASNISNTELCLLMSPFVVAAFLFVYALRPMTKTARSLPPLHCITFISATLSQSVTTTFFALTPFLNTLIAFCNECKPSSTTSTSGKHFNVPASKAGVM